MTPVIIWATSKYRIQNIQLSEILHEVIKFSDMFEFVDFKHFYRERNYLPDVLAKAGSNVVVGYPQITEHRAGESFEVVLLF